MEVLQTFFSQLTTVLPMDNLSEFDSRGLLPGNHKNKIKSLTTQPEKAEYFLDNVIRPGLEIEYDKQFKDLLKLMENSDDSKVKHLAEKIAAALTVASTSRDNQNTIKETTNYPSTLLKYSTSDINSAYHKLVSEITDIIETKNFKKMRRACYAEIRAIDSTLPVSLIQELQCTKSVDDMLDTLAMSPYWNWFDTRLLQALVSASGSSEAEAILEQFKQIYYARRVDEILPCVSVIPLKNTVIFTEKFNKEPHELTLLDIIKHKHILEYEVLDIGERKLILSCIKTGCVELTWHVPNELVYQAYTSMKRKHDLLSSLAVKSLVCEEADQYAGLPFLWRGQEVNEIGPIKPLPDCVRQEPYSLPLGFHWVTFSSNDTEIIVKFIDQQDLNFIHLSHVVFSHPNAKSEWQFGIRTTKGKLVGVVMTIPVCLSIRGASIPFVHPVIRCHHKYCNKRLWYILVKELERRINIYNVNQMIFCKESSMLKPVATTAVWKYHFNYFYCYQVPGSVATPGWRKMTPEDVPSALTLVNKYLSQFEISRIFTTEDFRFCFLRSADSYSFVNTYVVENMSNNITDLVSAIFQHDDDDGIDTLSACIMIVVSTQSPVKQLLMDMIVHVRDNGASDVIINQGNIASETLSSLLFKRINYDSSFYHFYNYKYQEISSDNFWHLFI